MLRTTTHTRLRIALEAPKLEVVTLEVVLRLEEHVQLVLMRVRDNVPRLFIYTARTLLGNSKVGKFAPPPSWEKFAPSLLLSHPWCLRKSPHRLLVGKSPHCHCYCHVRDITPPSSNEFPRVVLFILSKTETNNLLQEVHVIFTWIQLDLVLVLIQTCWIQISLALSFVEYWQCNFLIILGALARLATSSQVCSLTS